MVKYQQKEGISMLLTKDILDEKDKHLRAKNVDMKFPISDKEKKLIKDMLEHLYLSQIPEKAEELDLRPGMGLAGPQVGVNKRFFVVCYEKDNGKFENYVVINPTIISHSEEKIYTSGGEGCLSVNREVEGIVPRYARITVTGYDMDGNPVKYRVREELAVAFQHEIDHLNGILFFDYIDPKNPYKDAEFMRSI
jgi:peptide deformylase